MELARSLDGQGALDEDPRGFANAEGEAELGPDPSSSPLPRAVAAACRLMAPAVATAPAAWRAARALERETFEGVDFLTRAGAGPPWVVVHGLAGARPRRNFHLGETKPVFSISAAIDARSARRFARGANPSAPSDDPCGSHGGAACG